MSSWHLTVRLWGVRGSFPTPCAPNLGFGGNTPCVEIRLPGGEVLILDAGTGIRQLGLALNRETPRQAHLHLFITHFHWDHIHGLPFFAPLFDQTRISFYSGTRRSALEAAIFGQMKYPYFPLDFRTDVSNYDFFDMPPDGCTVNGVTVRAFPVHHPQGASGFRLDAGGKSVVYVPDREAAGNPALHDVLRKYAEGADLLIHDSQYTPEEYGLHQGWGHSTWLEAVQIAEEANVKQLVMFHHDPDHDDEQLTEIEQLARARFGRACMAREGWTATL